jgi:hypothetical protein
MANKVTKPTKNEQGMITRRLKRKYPQMYDENGKLKPKYKKKSWTEKMKARIRKTLAKDKKIETMATKETKKRLKKTAGIDWDKDKPSARLMKGKK